MKSGQGIQIPLPAKTADTGLYVRLAQDLLERNYFTFGELPRIVRTLERKNEESVGQAAGDGKLQESRPAC